MNVSAKNLISTTNVYLGEKGVNESGKRVRSRSLNQKSTIEKKSLPENRSHFYNNKTSLLALDVIANKKNIQSNLLLLDWMKTEDNGIISIKKRDLESTTFNVKILNKKVSCTLNFPKPKYHKDIIEIENSGMEWTKKTFFDKRVVSGLKQAYVGALVSIAYPNDLPLNKMIKIDQWLRLAFYADKIFDNLSAKSSQEVGRLIDRIKEVLKDENQLNNNDLDIVKGFHSVYFSDKIFQMAPIFLDSFFECLDKNLEEGMLRLSENKLSLCGIDRIRIKSCGGYHCIIVGATVCGVDIAALIKKFKTLDSMLLMVSLCTAWSNDIVSCNDEIKEVLKVLSDAKPPKIFYSLNIVQNKFFELLKNKKYSGDRALSASVEYVAQRFNNEISNFFTYIPMLKNELHINATEQEKKDVNKVLEIMTGWIESTAWRIITDKYTHERNDINTFINLLNNI